MSRLPGLQRHHGATVSTADFRAWAADATGHLRRQQDKGHERDGAHRVLPPPREVGHEPIRLETGTSLVIERPRGLRERVAGRFRGMSVRVSRRPIDPQVATCCHTPLFVSSPAYKGHMILVQASSATELAAKIEGGGDRFGKASPRPRS